MSGFSPRETCETVREVSAQLATLSHNAGLDVLAYILSMANLEAATVLAEIESRPPEVRTRRQMSEDDLPGYDDTRHVIETVLHSGA